MAKRKVEAAPAATNVLYVVTEKGSAVAEKTGNTVQRPEADKKYGLGWHKAGFQAVNTRAVTLTALAELGEFAEADGLAALAACGKEVLRSGTPRSYFAAFLKAGYVAELGAE